MKQAPLVGAAPSRRMPLSPHSLGAEDSRRGRRSYIRRGWRFQLLWAVLASLALTGLTQAQIKVSDDLDRELVLEQPAQRIISLAPHITELLFAVGAGEHVVGAVSYSDYPPAAKEIPRVGGFKSLDYERILALQPDLVIAWHSGNGAATIERLKKLDLNVYVSEPRTLTSVAHTLERLGRLAGSQDTGDRAAAEFRAEHERLAQRYSQRPPLKVFYQIWNRPLMTINGEHLISQVIELCGGRNIFAELGSLSATIDTEAVLKRAPEAIVASGMGEERPDWVDEWRDWPSLPAVKQENLFYIPPSLIQRQSPRILLGADRLCRQLEQAREAGQ